MSPLEYLTQSDSERLEKYWLFECQVPSYKTRALLSSYISRRNKRMQDDVIDEVLRRFQYPIL